MAKALEEIEAEKKVEPVKPKFSMAAILCIINKEFPTDVFIFDARDETEIKWKLMREQKPHASKRYDNTSIEQVYKAYINHLKNANLKFEEILARKDVNAPYKHLTVSR